MMKVFSLIMLMALCAISVQGQTDGTVALADTIYKTVEVMPEFTGGEKALKDYLILPYPPYARENDLEATVYVQFVIEVNGNLSGVIVVRTSGWMALDSRAAEHIWKMPQWKPGYQDGQPVRVSYVVPVKFMLN